jgi:hypothetical protein
MAQQKQSTQLQNTANPLLTLPGYSNGSDLSIPGNTVKPVRPWWRRAGIIAIVLFLLVVLAAGLLYTLLNQQPPRRTSTGR